MLTGAKVVAAFAAGIGCGVVATYSYFQDKFKKIADEEIAAMEFVLKREKEKKQEETYSHEETWKNPVENLKKRSTELTNYAKVTEGYTSTVAPSVNEMEKRIENMHQKMEELSEGEFPKEEIGEQYEITSMDWLDDAFYDKIILTYYVGDDTVANEAGMIDDVGMSIGMEEFERFKESDDMERYIRNPALGIDYNIVKDMGCYHV